MIETKFQRIEEEYQALRNAQNTILYDLDRSLPTIVKAIEQNRQGIEQNRQGIERNRQAIEKNSQAIAVLDSKINALISHFDVDYKPSMGFAPETDE